jgi:hypothetical protein
MGCILIHTEPFTARKFLPLFFFPEHCNNICLTSFSAKYMEHLPVSNSVLLTVTFKIPTVSHTTPLYSTGINLLFNSQKYNKEFFLLLSTNTFCPSVFLNLSLTTSHKKLYFSLVVSIKYYLILIFIFNCLVSLAFSPSLNYLSAIGNKFLLLYIQRKKYVPHYSPHRDDVWRTGDVTPCILEHGNRRKRVMSTKIRLLYFRYSLPVWSLRRRGKTVPAGNQTAFTLSCKP